MTFHDYLLQYLKDTVRITLSINNEKPFHYNYWNWFHKSGEFHLLREDYSIAHIIHGGYIIQNEDGSISLESDYHPKKCILNFYFGGVIP